MTRPTNKRIIKNNLRNNKLTFMCVFCFTYLAITKNHECNEAVEAGIEPKKVLAESLKKYRAFVAKYGKRAWTNHNDIEGTLKEIEMVEKRLEIYHEKGFKQ